MFSLRSSFPFFKQTKKISKIFNKRPLQHEIGQTKLFMFLRDVLKILSILGNFIQGVQKALIIIIRKNKFTFKFVLEYGIFIHRQLNFQN